MKKIIIITAAILMAIPFGTKAAFVVSTAPNKVEAGGACSENVEIKLAQTNTPAKIVYSAGALCKDGKFSFSDDLTQWNLPEGNYNVIINGEKKSDKITVKRENANAGKNQTTTSVQTEELGNPDTKFLGAFVKLQQSILDMHVWLAKTNYPSLLKTSIDVALDGIDIAVDNVSSLVLSGESAMADPGENAKPVEVINEKTEIQASAENIKTLQQSPADQLLTSGETILPSDGLSVAGKDSQAAGQ